MTSSSSDYDEYIKRKVQTYIDGVLSGEIPTGDLQRLAVERYVKDLKEGVERGLHFDEGDAVRVCRFFETYLKHSKGEFCGRPFYLEGWQAFILFNLFGWKREDGTRRFRIAYISVARKNGKSPLASGIGLYLTIADREPGANVYAAATKKDQARIVHDEAIRMIRKSERLSKRVNVPKSTNPRNAGFIYVPALDAEFLPLSADDSTMDGLNIHGAIVDELHAHKTPGVWDVITTATGARRQPLIVAITTAGYDITSVCYEQHQYSERVLDGTVEADSHFAFICSIDEGDNWQDPEVWKKANPNLGVSVSISDMEEQAEKAKNSPVFENTFRRLKCNQWTEQAERWLTMEAWNKAAGTVDIKALEGVKCWAGLDLADTTDTAALVLVFLVDEYRIVLPLFYCPEETVSRRTKSEGIPYRMWVDRGLVTATPGNVIDYRYIHNDIKRLAKTYKIKEIAYDPWHATELIQNLEDDGYVMVPMRQGYQTLSAPTKELLALTLNGLLVHGDNRVLNWQAMNMAVMTDPAGNVKPAKDKSKDKIDGMVALIMALDRANRHTTPKRKRKITERGFASL